MSDEIRDGVGTSLTFATSGFTIRKTTIGIPGINGGEKIDLTGLDNTAWMTGAPELLKSVDSVDFEGYLDPDMVTTAPVNVNQEIQFGFPSHAGGGTLTIWGYLSAFSGADAQKGQASKVTGTIEFTNRNNSGVETGPSYSE